jgi:4-coumarate--CoA ligase
MPFKSQWDLNYPNCSLPTLIFQSAHARLSDTPLIIDAEDPDNHYLTHSTYRLLSQRLACGLHLNGFKRGDRLLIFSGNNIYFPSMLMGTVMAGGIFSGANPGYVTRELAYQLQNSEARFLVCALASLDTGREAAKQVGLPLERVFYFDNSKEPAEPHDGVRHWSVLLASEEEGRRYEWDACTNPGENEQTIVLNYSSGTTGVPKGVEITHKNYVSNITVQCFLTELKENTPEMRKSTSLLCFLPLYHAMGQTHGCGSAPLLGEKQYVLPKFDFEKVLESVERFKVTRLILVPPVLIAMSKRPDVRRWKWNLDSIRDIVSGAAPLGRGPCEEVESLWKDKPQEKTINVRQGWGMTE